MDSTPRTSLPRQDQTTAIQEKIRLLEECERSIWKLKARLEAAEATRNSLRDEIAAYQARLAPVQNIPAIPSEILLMVFDLYMHEDPCKVCNLLLVCRQWYELIIGTPRLWTYIVFEVSSNRATKKSAQEIYRRIRTFMERSLPYLLEVELDLSEEVDTDTLICDSLRDSLIDIIDQGDQGGVAGVGYFIDDLRGHEFLDSLAEIYPFTSIYIDRVNYMLQGTSGKPKFTDYGRMTLQRLGSLKLYLGRDPVSAYTGWERMERPAPNLTHLCVRGLVRYRTYLPQGNDEWKRGPTKLDSLTHLEIDELDDLKCFDCKREQLESLTLSCDINSHTTAVLSTFTHLKTLMVTADIGAPTLTRVPLGQPVSMNSDGHLHMPFLRTLKLDGNFSHADSAKFTLPSLTYLFTNQEGTDLPRVHPTEVDWVLPEAIEEEDEGSIRQRMTRVLLEFAGAEHLLMSGATESALRDCIASLRAEGTLPEAWKMITFAPAGIDERTIRVEAMD